MLYQEYDLNWVDIGISLRSFTYKVRADNPALVPALRMTPDWQRTTLGRQRYAPTILSTTQRKFNLSIPNHLVTCEAFFLFFRSSLVRERSEADRGTSLLCNKASIWCKCWAGANPLQLSLARSALRQGQSGALTSSSACSICSPSFRHVRSWADGTN